MKEEKFIEQLQNKDYGAYNQLLNEYQQRVFNRCLSFVPNTEDAEDIAQEVFVEVFRSISKFKGQSKLSTWVYKITTTKCLEFIRKKNTKKRFAFLRSLVSDDWSLDKTNYFTEFNHPGIVLENKEKSEVLLQAINKLPESQRVVFTLSKIDDHSYKEIADITGKSIGSIESLLFRAKKNLQKILYNYYKNLEP